MTRQRQILGAIGRDQTGEVILESALAFVPVMLFFIALCQIADGYAHHLLVRRAASAAARAAAVVLPDDGVHYGDAQQRAVNQPIGARKRAIEDAALSVLRASPNFSPQSVRVRVSGRFAAGAPTTATVEADYECLLPAVSLLCGADRKLRLTGESALLHQFAPYHYTRGG